MTSKYIPGAVLCGAAELIRSLGADPLDLAERAGVPLASLEDEDIPVDITAVLNLFDLATSACNCQNFGMILASRNGMDIFGPLWILMRSARTWRQLLQDLSENYDMYTRAATASLEPSGDGLCLCWDTASNLSAKTAQGAEYGFALCVYEVRKFAPDFTPHAVEFRHAAPPDLSMHRQVFGNNLYFDQARNAIHFSNAILDQPLDSANVRAHRLMSSVLHWDVGFAQASLAERIEKMVRALLPHSPCTVEEVAQAVGTNERTLQNRLKKHHTSFKKIKESVRYDLALKYLHGSTLSMVEISEILGYSELSAFSRSFKRWHGQPCSKVRRNAASNQQSTVNVRVFSAPSGNRGMPSKGAMTP